MYFAFLLCFFYPLEFTRRMLVHYISIYAYTYMLSAVPLEAQRRPQNVVIWGPPFFYEQPTTNSPPRRSIKCACRQMKKSQTRKNFQIPLLFPITYFIITTYPLCLPRRSLGEAGWLTFFSTQIRISAQLWEDSISPYRKRSVLW
jgi:hypothetical protein